MPLLSILRQLRLVGAACGTLAVTGCAELGPLGPLDVALELRDAQVSASDPVIMVVTATNNTSARISWGIGSTSCTLGAAVRVDDAWVPILGERICTTDTGEHALEPGETRTEAFMWFGEVRRTGQSEPLPPGRYHVRGEAGSMGASRPVIIIVGAA